MLRIAVNAKCPASKNRFVPGHRGDSDEVLKSIALIFIRYIVWREGMDHRHLSAQNQLYYLIINILYVLLTDGKRRLFQSAAPGKIETAAYDNIPCAQGYSACLHNAGHCFLSLPQILWRPLADPSSYLPFQGLSARYIPSAGNREKLFPILNTMPVS